MKQIFTGLSTSAAATSSGDCSAVGDASDDMLWRRHRSNAPLAPLVMPAFISCEHITVLNIQTLQTMALTHRTVAASTVRHTRQCYQCSSLISLSVKTSELPSTSEWKRTWVPPASQPITYRSHLHTHEIFINNIIPSWKKYTYISQQNG